MYLVVGVRAVVPVLVPHVPPVSKLRLQLALVVLLIHREQVPPEHHPLNTFNPSIREKVLMVISNYLIGTKTLISQCNASCQYLALQIGKATEIRSKRTGLIPAFKIKCS